MGKIQINITIIDEKQFFLFNGKLECEFDNVLNLYFYIFSIPQMPNINIKIIGEKHYSIEKFFHYLAIVGEIIKFL
jgi:hypothetical protein